MVRGKAQMRRIENNTSRKSEPMHNGKRCLGSCTFLTKAAKMICTRQLQLMAVILSMLRMIFSHKCLYYMKKK
ncbi:hypothetical protein V6Z11_D13G162400 [Gossypium hirsutum]